MVESRQPSGDGGARRAAANRRRLAEVFGEVLPETTDDEREAGTGERSGGDDTESWYRRNRPPHHE